MEPFCGGGVSACHFAVTLDAAGRRPDRRVFLFDLGGLALEEGDVAEIVSTREFDPLLSLLYTSPEWFIEIRGQEWPTPKDGKLKFREWYHWPSDADQIGTALRIRSGKINLWMGIAPRKGRAGTKEDILCYPAVWCDLDFKTTPRDQAVSNLKSFKLRPSVGIETGGGFHVVWILSQPVDGKDVAKVEAINRAIAQALGADIQAVTGTFGLRIPGTLNVKYDPPLPVKVVVGPHPDRKYQISDFNFLPIKEKHSTNIPPPPEGSLHLAPELREKIIEASKPLWLEGFRHSISKDLSGYLLKNGISEEDVKSLIHAICFMTGDKELRDRLTAVKTTFETSREGKPVAGFKGLEEVVHAFPDNYHQIGLKALDALERLFQKKRGQGFQITKVTKIEYDPPQYDVVIRIGDDEKEYSTRCVLEEFSRIDRFRLIFFSKHDFWPPMMKQAVWEKKSTEKPFEKQAVERWVSGVRGEIESALEEFVARAVAKSPEANVHHLPIIEDETGQVYLTTPAFMKFLHDQKVETKRNVVIDVFRGVGLKQSTKRFGKSTSKVWIYEGVNGNKPHGGNGQDLFKQESVTEKPLHM